MQYSVEKNWSNLFNSISGMYMKPERYYTNRHIYTGIDHASPSFVRSNISNLRKWITLKILPSIRMAKNHVFLQQ